MKKVTVELAQYACGEWYEIKVNGVVVACCGTFHGALEIAKNS